MKGKETAKLESSLGIKADVISMAKRFTTFCLDIIDIITFMLNWIHFMTIHQNEVKYVWINGVIFPSPVSLLVVNLDHVAAGNHRESL